MGGSGGNSTFGGGGAWSPQEVACESLRFRTVVVSPDLGVLATLTEKDILDVVLNSQDRSIQVITTAKEVLGDLLPSQLGKLVQCINNGTSYKAKIQSIQSPRCEVEVYAV